MLVISVIVVSLLIVIAMLCAAYKIGYEKGYLHSDSAWQRQISKTFDRMSKCYSNTSCSHNDKMWVYSSSEMPK